MTALTRRQFSLSLLLAGSAAGLGLVPRSAGATLAVVGGGPAGAAAALSLRGRHPDTRILLFERDPARLAPGAAAVGAFEKPTAGPDLTTLTAAGIEVLLDEVVSVDWRAGRLECQSGRRPAFDRLIVAPGTAGQAEAIPGLDAVARHRWPAAWGSATEARRLTAQLAALPDRGHVVLRLPETGLSHPDVALERAISLRRWLGRERPTARLTILDGGALPGMAAAFAARTAATPGPAPNWLGPDLGGRVQAVDAHTGRIVTDKGDLHADVVNFVPPQGAGTLARSAGLTDDSGWCPCAPDGRSLLQDGAVVLGDARKGQMRSLSAARRSGLSFVRA